MVIIMKDKILKIVKEVIPYIVILIAVVLIRTYLITPVIVSGQSMVPTLDGGELMILNKRAKIDRFDIVVVKLTKQGRKEDIIKRVIALPGETISCEDGVVYVNGKRQDEEYSKGKTENFERIELADDEYFVMGDNREDSADSRIFGPFKKNKIIGISNRYIINYYLFNYHK